MGAAEDEAARRIAEAGALGSTSLDLSELGLVELPPELAELTGLANLNLSHNQLLSLPGWLATLSLSHLKADSNRLTELPEWLADMKLSSLDIGHNELRDLPEFLGDNSTLEQLGIAGCELVELPGWMATMTGLRTLDVSSNGLLHLPDWLPRLRGLRTLDLARNRFVEPPEVLRGLTGLNRLFLDHNGLVELPDWLAELAELTDLDASSNRLTQLPPSLATLHNLSYLSLRSNRLTEIPAWIDELTELGRLDVTRNRLSALPESIGNLPRLTALLLNENRLTSLPDSIGELDQLAVLNASRNRLAECPDVIGRLRELSSLNLERNRLATMPAELGSLAKLKALDLNGNELTSLPDGIRSLHRISRLTLSSNEITTLPNWLTEMPNLEEFFVRGNPLVSPPPEITEGGSEPVLEFLRSRQQGSTAQWVSKLLVVGEGGVGKTSLVRALAGQEHDPEEPSTHGLRIQDLDVAHPFLPGITMRMSAWDFGGQQIYHATHQFFLTNRSLFLLLWNARHGWEHGKLRYWLDIITARAPESPILIVATHSLERPVDLPLEELRHEYPRIVGHVAVDNAGGHGIDGLYARFADLAADLPLMGSEWPSTWLAAANAVRRAAERYVTSERMWQLMSAAGVGDPTHQRYVAMALHQLGDILWYAEDPELAQTVVLQPEWVNEYISKVLDSDEVARRKGLLGRGHLAELWSDLDQGLRDHFLGMMDRYDLSYRIEQTASTTDDVSLVVERLPWEPPPYAERWDEIGAAEGTQEIRVQYQLNTMPPGIPTWFIARSHRFSTGLHWRTGALLRHTDHRHLALLRAHTGQGRIELTVRGPAPAAFFSILDDGLNLTLERFPGLRIVRQVPCDCGRLTGTPCLGLFDYDDLSRRLERDPPRTEIECHKSGEMVDVRTLLLGLAPPRRDTTRTSLERIERKLDGLRDQQEYSQLELLRQLRALQEQQEIRCPSVFTVVPAGRRRLTGSAYELRLYCEEPGAWHPLPESDGCYPVNRPAEWVQRFGPYLQLVLSVLRHAGPLVGPILGMAAGTLDERVRSECELMKELMEQMPARVRIGDDLGGLPPGDVPAARATEEADFRTLDMMLTRLDPDQRWGGLSRHTTPEGLTLYLCREHVASYRAGR